MKTWMFVLLFMATSAFAQTTKFATTDTSSRVWQTPFASKDNTISLSVENNSNITAKAVSVAFSKLPDWLEFKSTTVSLEDLSPNSSKDAEFTFSVDKKAPVGIQTKITAEIKTADGQKRVKEITLSVSAPKDYKLYDNFPNPFNPSTKIAFELPKASHVKLIIYDIVGREVAQVADGDYPAGYTALTWNGLNRNGNLVSSGVYFYRLSADKWNKVKKMLMLK